MPPKAEHVVSRHRMDDDTDHLMQQDEALARALAAVDEDALALTAFHTDFNEHYGLLPPESTVVVRAYSDDTDDRMLEELKPRFIVMYEPNMDFVRRVEVCSVYFLSSDTLIDDLNRFTSCRTLDCHYGCIIWFTPTLVKSTSIWLESAGKRRASKS